MKFALTTKIYDLSIHNSSNEVIVLSIKRFHNQSTVILIAIKINRLTNSLSFGIKIITCLVLVDVKIFNDGYDRFFHAQ
jgi:hypothetical protein